jgi:hypothetical protein
MGLPASPSTQLMMHWSSAAQAGSVRQAAAWAQQLLARQLPQMDPSLGHLGEPHTPPLHCPAQHWAALVQVPPSGRQALTQIPPAQLPEQQSENLMHIPPLPVHMSGPQRFWTLHGPEQQGCWGTQISPLGVQLGVLQIPLMHAPQQIGPTPASLTQGEPLGWQRGGPHTPPLHWPSQQSVGNMQARPFGRQVVGPQKPMALHGPEQHFCAGVHMNPSGRHVVGLQVPLMQASGAQQAAPTGEHANPGGRHAPPPHTPLMQARPQQLAPGKLQAAPAGRHALIPHRPLVQAPVQH